MDKKLFEGLSLILIGWFGYKWPFKTGGRWTATATLRQPLNTGKNYND